MKKNVAIMFLAFLLSGTLFCNDFGTLGFPHGRITIWDSEL